MPFFVRIFAAISFYLCCLILITQKQKEQNQGEKQTKEQPGKDQPKRQKCFKICPVF